MKELLQRIVALFKKPAPQVPAPTPSVTQPIDREMHVSKDCIDIIKYYEGLRLNAYLDVKGVPTIGYGDTGPHVKMGQSITVDEAERRLMRRLREEFEPGVRAALTRVPEQFEFDAMVSLAYNIGVSAFRNSTLVKKFNAGDTNGAADQFLVWVRSGNEKPLGLKRRRATERCLFMKWGVDAALAYGKTAA